MLDLPPLDPAIEITVASRGMSQGTAQTKGSQLVGRATIQIGDVQIGGQWKNLTSPAADGVAMVFVTATQRRGSLRLNLSAAYKFQTGVHRKTDSDGFEFTSAVNHSFGRVELRGSVAYSPDDVGKTRQSFYFEGGPTIHIGKSTRLVANIGRREQDGSPDYTSFNAGISRTVLKGLTIEARYYGTTRGGLGEAYQGRAVISARLTY